jgi:hypothetical protein
VFVPDYENGYAPYGVWAASRLFTLINYFRPTAACGTVLSRASEHVV